MKASRPWDSAASGRARLLALPGLIVGVAAALFGSGWLIVTAIFVARASSTVGVVDKIEDSNVTNASWYATLSFKDAAGAAHAARTWFMFPTFCPPVSAGQSVPVLYDPSSPQRAKIDSFATVWFAPLAASGFGVFFVVGSGGLLLAVKRIDRVSQERAGEENVAL